MNSRTHTPSRLLALLSLLAVAQASGDPRVGGDVAEYAVADPDAPVVTGQNLLESEAFWPFRVALTREWTPAGSAAAIEPGFPGILLRVEPDARLRIDFGRQGAHTVPLAATDLVERANRVRTGQLDKLGPNLVRVVGPHLSPSGGGSVRPLDFDEAAGYRAFLFVFADPAAEGFPALAAALATLPEPAGVGHVLFPQGGHAADEVMRLLGASGWTPAFVYSMHVGSLTRSFLDDPAALPALELETGQGRSLLSARWSASEPALLERLRTALVAAGTATQVAGEPR